MSAATKIMWMLLGLGVALIVLSLAIGYGNDYQSCHRQILVRKTDRASLRLDAGFQHSLAQFDDQNDQQVRPLLDADGAPVYYPGAHKKIMLSRQGVRNWVATHKAALADKLPVPNCGQFPPPND